MKLPKMQKLTFNPKALIPTASHVARGQFLLNIAIALAILIIFNMIMKTVTLRYDLTSNKQYSLSDETAKLLQSIENDVQVVAYVSQADRAETERMLKEYTLRNNKIKVEYVDVERQPARAINDGITRSGSIVFRREGTKELANSATETEITSALYKIENPERNKVLFFGGSGEKSIENRGNDGLSELSTTLGRLNYEVSEKNAVNETTIPDDIDVVVIAGPQTSLTQAQQNSLNNFIDKGGKLFIMVDPRTNGAPYGLESVFAKFGVEIKPGAIVERARNIQGDATAFTLERYESHPITQRLPITAFFNATVVVQSAQKPEKVTVTPIVRTTSDSWLETTLVEGSVPTADANELKGSLNVGVVSVIDHDGETPDARLVLIADSEFPINVFVTANRQNPYYVPGNIDLFSNSMNWLVAREGLFNIVPKERSQPRLTLNEQQKNILLATVLAGIPAIPLLVGGYIIRNRKRQ